MSEWQPIETAPTGVHLLYFPDEGMRGNRLTERMIVDRVPYPHPRQPTHWMPLPDPPE